MPSSRDIRAGGAFVEFTLRRKGLERALRQVARRLQRFGSSLQRTGLRIAALGAALTTPFAVAVKVFASTGDALDKLSRRTGFTVETLSELDFAARQSGTSLDVLKNGVRTMQKNVVDLGRGLATQKDAFGALGLTFEQLSGLSPEKQFELIADRIASIKDPTERAARAMQVFGTRSGQELIPLLEGGARGIADLRREARELGLTIDKDTTDKAAALTDAISRLKLQARATAINIGAALAPALTKAAKIISKIGKSVIQFTKENKKLIAGIAVVATGVLTLGSVLAAFGVAAGLAGFALAGIVSGVIALGATLGAIAFPAVVAIGAIAAVGYALYKFTNLIQSSTKFIRKELAQIIVVARKTGKGIADALAAEDIGLALRIGFIGAHIIARKGMLAVLQAIINTGTLISRNVIEVAAGAAGAFVNAWATVRRATTRLGTLLGGVFFRVLSVAKTAFAHIKFGAKNALILLRQLIDPDFSRSDGRRARLLAISDLGQDIKNAERARRGQIKGLEVLEGFVLNSIERERQARLDMVRDTLDAAIKASKTLGTFATLGFRIEIARLEAEQGKLLDEAAVAAAAKRFSDKVRGFFAGSASFDSPSGTFDLDDKFSQLRRASQGITSSFDIRSLGNAGGLENTVRGIDRKAERLLRHIQAIDHNLKPGVQPGGLAVT